MHVGCVMISGYDIVENFGWNQILLTRTCKGCKVNI